MRLNIAIVVHGRFHAFHLVRELIRRGHEVTLFTNYPKNIVARFGIPKKNVKSFLLHGVVSRIIHFLNQNRGLPSFEPFLHSRFSKWAARKITKDRYDITHCFSGVAEELFCALDTCQGLKTLVRGSTHIRTQSELLIAEERRSGVPIDKPSTWMIEREEREYRLADKIVVLATFSRHSFIEQGVQPSKLWCLPLGSDLKRFRPTGEIIQERCRRITSSQPLRVLMVGTFSFRKGALDLVKIASVLNASFVFRFVGAVSLEAKCLAEQSARAIEFIPRVPEFALPSQYAWGDLFVFPTIEDGYAVVLAQAQAAGLPILTTPNCSGPDLLQEGGTGWIVPIRNPDAFVERLQWCNAHRAELAEMVEGIYSNFRPRDWADVAADFETLCEKRLRQPRQEV